MIINYSAQITYDTETQEYTSWNTLHTIEIAKTKYPIIADMAIDAFLEYYPDNF